MDEPAGRAPQEWYVDPSDWERAVAAVDGPQVVVGGPGTGKTEFLVRRIVHLIEHCDVDPADVVVLSFGRRGVADIRARVRGRLARSVGEVDVATFHSYAARLLERQAHVDGLVGPPQILTGPEQAALVRELLDGEDPTHWSIAFRGLLSTTTFAREVTDFLLRASEQMISDAELAAMADDRADWRGLPRFRSRYRAALDRLGRVDYGELVARAVVVADGQGGPGPSHVLVDEFQDTTASQARLVGALAGQGGNITAAGDPYQSVYSFRGARLENIAEFPDRHRGPDGAPARRIVLTTSFRCPAAVLDAAVRVTERDIPGSAGKVVPASSGGSVVVHRFDQQTAEAEWIASEIERLNLSEGLPLRRIGVLVRSKRRFLPEMSRSLERRHIAHDPPESRLSEQPAVRFLLDAVTVASGDDLPSEIDRAVRRLLLGPLFAVPLGRLRDIERHHEARGAPWSESVSALVPEGDGLAALLEHGAWATEWDVRRGFWHAWSTVPQVGALASDPHRREELRAWSSLGQVIDRWGERNPRATLADYRRLLDQEEFEARPLLSYRTPDRDRVTLTTLHQAKGLEFDVVFIADAVEGVFPDLRTRDSLLGVRHVLRRDEESTAEYLRFRLQEERRLAYTAMTRSTGRVIWTATASGAEEGRGMPSRFLPLVAGTTTLDEAVTPVDGETVPVSRRDAESHLRRMMADPSVSRPRRLAAAGALASGTRWGLRPVGSFHGVRERGPDRGLVDQGSLRLSPSQAESYARCPRRYALERRLRIGDSTSIYAEFGTLIHDVLEAAERAAFEAGRDRSDVSEALDILEARFDHATFGGPPFSVAWHRRGVDLLDRLYTVWPPASGRVVALEHELHMDIEGIPWIGYADRIEASQDGLKIVDYKTSKNAPTVDTAARSVQLGFYFAAAAADPEVAAHGTPTAAEMWYPAATSVGMTTRALDTSKLDDVMTAMADVTKGIADERFPPLVGDDCERCPVRLVCPAWPEGGEDFA